MPAGAAEPGASPSEALTALGWDEAFNAAFAASGREGVPARVVEQHRRELVVDGPGGRRRVPVRANLPPVTVGDWVVVDDSGSIAALLPRRSAFRRKAPGRAMDEQLLAANVDTAFIVCSLNEDFSLNRIERYLAVVYEAGATPVVVLTKRDCCPAPETRIAQVQGLDPDLAVVAVDARTPAAAEALSRWCAPGRTVVLLGSSGAGKSTLTNSLVGEPVQETGAVRERDAKGRHTTRRRSLLRIPGGGLVIDTPGIRELQLSECEAGVAAAFRDIEQLARQCRFNDCSHEQEPGCAVQAALRGGQLDPRRLDSYRSLMREQALNAQMLARRHERDGRRSGGRPQRRRRADADGEEG